MKTIIAGSRDISDESIVEDAIREAINKQGFEITEVVSGTAPGVDTLGEEWADDNGIPVKQFPYENYMDASKKQPAPLVRNDKMAEYAHQAIIIWDGQSNGTEYMYDKAREEGLDIHLTRTDSQSLDEWV